MSGGGEPLGGLRDDVVQALHEAACLSDDGPAGCGLADTALAVIANHLPTRADLTAALDALADSWDGSEDSGVRHMTACQTTNCRTCAVIACATDLRAALKELR